MKWIALLIALAAAASAWAQAPTPTKEAAKPEAVPMKSEPPKQAVRMAKKSSSRRSQDARHCLQRASNTEIIKCAEEFL